MLLVLNIIVSCLVICFSYGLYQSYNVVIKEGTQPNYTEISVSSPREKKHESEEYEIDLSEVTLGEFLDMLSSLSDDFTDSISGVNMLFGVKQDLYRESKEHIIVSDTGIYAAYFHLDVKHHSVTAGGKDSGFISDEDYASGKKVVALGTEMFTDQHGGAIGHSSKSYDIVHLKDEQYITIEGERYEIIRIDKAIDGKMVFPVTSLPRDLKLWCDPLQNDEMFEVSFNEPLKATQYYEFREAVEKYFGDRAVLPKVEFKSAEELYYYRTILLISVVIAILAAINMAVLYRYILERRGRELTVFRLCGCKRSAAVRMYLAECLILSLPLFALTELLWHRLVMPRFASLFEHFESAYSFKLYAAVFGIYAVSVTAVMLIMITLSVRKHTLIELKAKSTRSAMPIFKIFEAVQLTAVLSLAVTISSAFISRYELYSPFSDLLNDKGYAVSYQGGFMYGDDFRSLIGDSEGLLTYWADYEIEGLTGNGATVRFIPYDKELIEKFSPQLEGVWLNASGHSYASDKVIPMIVPPDSPYNIGDRLISPDNMTAWDEDYNPIRVEDLTFEVVGKLKDNAAVFSYPYPMGVPIDYLSLYGIYNGEFVDVDAFLIREEDIYEIYGIHSPILGIQLVRCRDMSDEEYIQLGKTLSSLSGASVTSFEKLNSASRAYIFEQMKTVFPIALCIFILTVISSISISAIYTKRHLHTYAVLYICGATWRSCALRSLRAGLITCGVSAALTAAVLGIGKLTFMKDTVVTFGLIPLAVCAGVLLLYVALSMIMPLLIIGKTEPREVLKEE